MAELYHVSEQELAEAIAEWDRRWREEPDRFLSETEHLATETKEYGEMCAAYLVFMLGEMKKTLGEVLADPDDDRASWPKEGNDG